LSGCDATSEPVAAAVRVRSSRWRRWTRVRHGAFRRTEFEETVGGSDAISSGCLFSAAGTRLTAEARDVRTAWIARDAAPGAAGARAKEAIARDSPGAGGGTRPPTPRPTARRRSTRCSPPGAEVCEPADGRSSGGSGCWQPDPRRSREARCARGPSRALDGMLGTFVRSPGRTCVKWGRRGAHSPPTRDAMTEAQDAMTEVTTTHHPPGGAGLRKRAASAGLARRVVPGAGIETCDTVWGDKKTGLMDDKGSPQRAGDQEGAPRASDREPARNRGKSLRACLRKLEKSLT